MENKFKEAYGIDSFFVRIQEYFTELWVKNEIIGSVDDQLNEIERLGSTIISVHYREKDCEGVMQDVFVDVRKGGALWS